MAYRPFLLILGLTTTSRAEILTNISAVLAAFMRNNTYGDCLWGRATYFHGHSEAMQLLNQTAPFEFARTWASQNNWECNGSFFPGDSGPGWAYSNLYEIGPQEDYMLALGVTMSRLLASGMPRYNWFWVDTMATCIAEWLWYGKQLLRDDFTQIVKQQYNDTKYGGPAGLLSQPGLFSTKHGLWFRDKSFMNKTAPNGSPVFWGRGNGWAAIMIAKTLSLGILPETDALRLDLENTLRTMAIALAPLQGSDGFWRSSLMDPAHFPTPETTGTAGITYMLAYGVRTGLLPPSYAPVVALAWSGLSTVSLGTDGSVGWCQPVGAAPAASALNSTSDFCTGLWLLAATEIYKLGT